MKWKFFKAIIILPFNVLIVIPALILYVTGNGSLLSGYVSANTIYFWAGLGLGIPGLSLVLWSLTLFYMVGNGTPAPWDPPKKLIIRGPYCHVRNPMITAVLLLLASEALLFKSGPIAIWMAIFFGGNAFYFPFFEEKKLDERFGYDYVEYRLNVPRWIPRLRPWRPEKKMEL